MRVFWTKWRPVGAANRGRWRNLPKSKFASNSGRFFLAFALLAAAAWGLSGILGNGFIELDDHGYVLENSHVLGGVKPENIQWAFVSTEMSNWHPLTWLSHQVDVQLFGLDPAGHHGMSLLLHLITTLFLFLFLHRLTGSEWKSAAASFLFAIHPLHVESVAWEAERKDLLCGLFWALGLLAYTHYAASPSPRRYVKVCVFFLLALLSKPMAVTFPVVLLLLDFWPLGRLDKVPFRLLLREKGPLILLSCASALLTYVIQRNGGAVDIDPGSFIINAGNALNSYLFYLKKMIWPVDLAAFYPFDPSSVTISRGALSLAVLVGITAVAVGQRKKKPYLLFGWGWYIVTLFPVAGFVRTGMQGAADRYTYLPLIGPFVAVVWMVADFTRRAPFRQQLRVLITIPVAVALFLATRMEVRYWRTTEMLFSRAVAVTENNWVAHHVLGLSFQRRGFFGEAIGEYRQSIQLQPAYAAAWFNLGNAYGASGNYREAVTAYRQTLNLSPADTDASMRLVIASVQAGDLEGARIEYRRFSTVFPDAVTDVLGTVRPFLPRD